MLHRARELTRWRVEWGREMDRGTKQNIVMLRLFHCSLDSGPRFALRNLCFGSNNCGPCFLSSNGIMKILYPLACSVSEIPGTWGHLQVQGPLRLWARNTVKSRSPVWPVVPNRPLKGSDTSGSSWNLVVCPSRTLANFTGTK